MKQLITPLNRAKGLGSAKEGVSHWWNQRLTSLALVPLGFWFTFSILTYVGGEYAAVTDWLSSPGAATLMVLFLGVMFYHSVLGLQVVIEDYVHNEGLKVTCLLLMKFLSALVGVSAVLAVLKLAM